jgi:hypothetical protein
MTEAQRKELEKVGMGESGLIIVGLGHALKWKSAKRRFHPLARASGPASLLAARGFSLADRGERVKAKTAIVQDALIWPIK